MDDVPLLQQRCTPYDSDQKALERSQIDSLIKQLDPDWTPGPEQHQISRIFKFKNYCQTISLVNAIAWIANAEDHHPELEVSYRVCHVIYSTHSVGGLSPNDFICAAKIDALIG